MKKVFIDCGAHDGCSVRKFMTEYDKNNEYEYHCFEVNRKLFTFYDDIDSKITLYNQAVSHKDGDVNMLLMGLTGGTTINENKKQTLIHKQYQRNECMLFDFNQVCKIGKLEEEKINCIRLSRWLYDKFNEDDYIVIKMDIEGAEYEIIADMLSEQTFQMVNELYIEFHMQQQYDVGGYIRKITEQNSDIFIDSTWDAMHPPYLKNQLCEEYYRKILKDKIIDKFRAPLSKEEKIKAINIFANDNIKFNINSLQNIKLDNHADFLNLRNALDTYNKVEDWKKYILKIATEEISLK